MKQLSRNPFRVIVVITLVGVLSAAMASGGSSDPGVAAAVAAEQPYEWELLGRPQGAPLRDSKYVALNNQTNDQAIRYQERTFGINLGWRHWSSGNNLWFKRRATDGATRVQYNERVAIYVSGGGYLKYGSRVFGINLKWSATPVYEWEVRGKNRTAGNVRMGQAVALYNWVHHAYVVHGIQNYGINLKWWPNSPTTTTTSNVSHAFRVGPFPSGFGQCTGTLQWRFEPVSLIGNTGEATTFSITRSYSTLPTNTGPSEYYCISRTLTGNLRPGTWRIEVQAPLWVANCEVRLHAGNNVVNFTQYRHGCGTGFEWP